MVDYPAEAQRSALAGLDLGSRAGGAGGVLLGEAPARVSLVLRGRADDAVFAAGVEAALGAGLPREPGAAVEGEDGALAFRLGPDEWRLLAPPAAGARLAERLGAGLAGSGAALVDMSAASTVIAVTGGHAADLLATGTGIDLDAEAFPPGRAVRTRIGNAQALLYRSGPDAFELHIPRSYARSFWEWLEAAGGEFDAAIAL